MKKQGAANKSNHSVSPAHIVSAKTPLQLFLQTSTALLQGHNEQETLDLIVKGVASLGFVRARLYLLSADKKRLEAKAHVGMDDSFIKASWFVKEDCHMQRLMLEPRTCVFNYEKDGEPIHDEYGFKDGITEWLSSPLIWQDEVIGQIAADNGPTARSITEQDIDLISLFATLAAPAIRRVQNLSTILKVSATVNSTADFNQVLTEVCQAAVELLGVEHSALAIFDPRVEFAEVRAEYPNFGARGLKLPLRGVEDEENLIASKGPLHITSVEQRATLGPIQDILRDLNIHSLLIVPIVINGHAIGSFSLDSIGHPRVFTEEEIRLCEVFAAQLASAIEIRQQKDHLARLVASSLSGIIAINVTGKVTEFNGQAEKILGYKKEEVLGTDVAHLFADALEPRRIGRRLYEDSRGIMIGHETAVRAKNDESIPVRLSATWLKDSEGQRIGSAGYFEDLRTIHESEKRFEVLLDANRIITEAEKMDDGLEHLAKKIVHLLGSTFCRISLSDESDRFLRLQGAYLDSPAGQVRDDSTELSRLRLLTSWHQEMLAKGEPIVLDSLAKGDAVFADFSDALKAGEGRLSLLMVPLQMGGRSLGLLEVGEVSAESGHTFTKEKTDLATAIARNAAALVYRLRRLAVIEHRKKLQDTMHKLLLNLRAINEPEKLCQEITRLAAELFDCQAAALYTLKGDGTHKFSWCDSQGADTAVSPSWLGQAIALGDRVAFSGKAESYHLDGEVYNSGNEMGTLIGVPLKQWDEEQLILLTAYKAEQLQYLSTDLDILAQYAAQTALVLQTSETVTLGQRTVNRVLILQEIRDYILRVQVEEDLDKILHAILTGVTAGYGSSFNRAMIFLRDEYEENQLVGHIGIGQFGLDEARQAWDDNPQRGISDFKVYLQQINRQPLPVTPVWNALKKCRLALNQRPGDAIWDVVETQQVQLVRQSEMNRLPEEYSRLFDPTSDVIIIPLKGRDQVIGVLIADNKFTHSPITDWDIESLQIYADIAAIAIDNVKLFGENKAAREMLDSLFKASNALISAQPPEEVLRDIIEKMRGATGADWVRVIVINEDVEFVLDTEGAPPQPPHPELVRSNGITSEVVSSGQPIVIEDALNEKTRLNPALRGKVGAVVCLPFLLRGRTIGVIWVAYENRRRFSESEREALQLYVNQAAIAYDNAERFERLEKMRDAGAKRAGTVQTAEVLSHLVNSAVEVLKADSAVFFSYDNESRRFSKAASVHCRLAESDWEALWEEGAHMQKIGERVMRQGYVPISDITQCGSYLTMDPLEQQLLQRIGVKSFQGVALEEGGQKLGVLFFNYNRLHRFIEDEKHTAITYAEHAAVGIVKARLMDQLQTVIKAVHVVTEVTAQENFQCAFQSIVKGAGETLGCGVVTLYIYDAAQEEFDYPPALIGVNNQEEVTKLGRVTEGSRIRAVLTLTETDEHHLLKNGLYVAEDALHDSLLGGEFCRRENIKSSVAVPLVVGVGDQKIKVGVMFFNYRTYHRFTDQDLTNIRLFANQAAVAIRNTQLYQQAEDQMTQLAASVSVAWMGMTSATWRHAIDGHALTINETVDAIIRQLPDMPTDAPIQQKLARIKRLAGQIQSKPITPSLSEASPVNIGEFMDMRLQQLWKNEPYRQIALSPSLAATHGLQVRADSVWLRIALDFLIDNAVKAMSDSEKRELKVAVRPVGRWVEIALSDTGNGIDASVQADLGKRPIAKASGDKGMGMGFLQAQVIIQKFGGEIKIEATSPAGTTMLVRLPLMN